MAPAAALSSGSSYIINKFIKVAGEARECAKAIYGVERRIECEVCVFFVDVVVVVLYLLVVVLAVLVVVLLLLVVILLLVVAVLCCYSFL